MERRVVITGLGAVTPIGNDVDTFWENLKAGKCGITKITKFDSTDFKAHVAAEVKDFDPLLYMDKGEVRKNDPFSQFAIAAATQAVNDSETMDALSAMWNNFCVTDIYEPGSVVKPIVMAAALEQGKISTSDTFYCDGYQNFGVPGNMTTIKCANIYGHGMETLAEVIAYS